MNVKTVIGASLLAASMTAGATAAGPGVPGFIDRPTPPACCADGICYPNAATWGAYPTRWRRWPAEALVPTPADGGPGRPSLELRPYEPLRPEEEDRRAPPPIPTPEQEEPETEGAVTRPPTTAPSTTPPSTYPPSTTPGTPPLTPPGNLELPTRSPFEDDEPTQPTTEPGNLLPFGQLDSQGDDPPPAPPFRAPAVANAPVLRKVELPKVSPSPSPARRAVAPSQPGNSDDPPPAFPLTLG
jgi:hypothetical protein